MMTEEVGGSKLHGRTAMGKAIDIGKRTKEKKKAI
jgi:hypothetical protein